MGSLDQRSPDGDRYFNDTLIRDDANPEHRYLYVGQRAQSWALRRRGTYLTAVSWSQ
jgi:hypothetical protein